MAQGIPPVPDPGQRRGMGVELWLLRPGPALELEERLRAFASTRFAQVLSGPGPEESAWAAAFARASQIESTCDHALAPAAGEASAALAARAWAALERALGSGTGPLLAVLAPEVLGPVVAQALGFPLARAGALCVAPGRAVLLRDDPVGIVLRRSNVRAPERSAGTPLPAAGPRPEAAR